MAKKSQESPNTYRDKYKNNNSGTDLNYAGIAMLFLGYCCNLK